MLVKRRLVYDKKRENEHSKTEHVKGAYSVQEFLCAILADVGALTQRDDIEARQSA